MDVVLFFNTLIKLYKQMDGFGEQLTGNFAANVRTMRTCLICVLYGKLIF